MMPARLYDFARRCAREGTPESAAIAFEVMVKRSGDGPTMWREVWPAFQGVSDADAVARIDAMLAVVTDFQPLLAAVDDDVRCCFLFGQVHAARAIRYKHKSSSQHRFDHNKNQALHFLEATRERVGAAYEAMLYASYTPHQGRGAASSSVGG
jgi:hypothetical protein